MMVSRIWNLITNQIKSNVIVSVRFNLRNKRFSNVSEIIYKQDHIGTNLWTPITHNLEIVQ